MGKRLGTKTFVGIAALAATVGGVAGVAAAGAGGDAVRTGGGAAAAHVRESADAGRAAAWYARGMGEVAVGQSAERMERKVNAAVAEEHRDSGASGQPPQAHPVRDTMDDFSRLAAEVDGTLDDTGSSTAETVAAGAAGVAASVDEAEDALRR